MKKETPKLEEVKGWTVITRSRSFCGACGHLITFEDPLYHRRDGDRSVIRCFSCVKDK